MSSTNQPPDLSTGMSTLAISALDTPSINPPRRRLAPHRKYAMKFLTLPDELLMNISDNVAYEDLPNFRLTCKTLANIAAKRFGENGLAHRRFIFTEHSLTSLVDMTAHSVFGPCIKSIMFGTDHLTNDLEVLMDALESNKITDPAKAMGILQTYRERYNRRSKFLGSQEMSSLLDEAFRNLSWHGATVSLGIFNDVRVEYRKEGCLPGYGSFREFGGLPFQRFITSNERTFGLLRSACNWADFRPKFFEFDLRGQEDDNGMRTALNNLLLTKAWLISSTDICIREGEVDILILPSLNRLEFKQRPELNQLYIPENLRFSLKSLGRPMRNAICSMHFTHLRMEACSMWFSDFMDILEPLANTLRVVELVDVAFWGDVEPDTNVGPILDCLRDQCRLRTLVLDNLRAMNKNYSGDTGILMAKGRFWHGKQQIHAGIDILTIYGGYGWDDEIVDDWGEDGIISTERELQGMTYSQYEQSMNYTEYLEYKAEQEETLEDRKLDIAKSKVARAEAKEAMARVEAREFDT
ncbi:hypothetical protein E4T50_00663 [Aureobasidium sp. EXF-12298]|nr:hypothetical protein E4T50_00663 [Aureobasidium sp. EXF-12298]KAI4764073.1 hypothetical protein E4T51_02900 [Aureobasidium sp. EXF-12344]KAI4784033.1 hypothetical protein E4T52_01073 [Aureobasidium sp. EXF-3400]